ncbi:MAG: hypothetical protein R2707_02895 [Acidimicrobiales bacterium]
MTANTTAQITRTAQVDGRTLLDVSLLRSKAADLRGAASDLGAPLSTTYRRRAAELELEAAALAARFGLIEELTLAA